MTNNVMKNLVMFVHTRVRLVLVPRVERLLNIENMFNLFTSAAHDDYNISGE